MVLKVEKKPSRGSRRWRRKPSLRRYLREKKPKAGKKLPKEGGAVALGAGEDDAARAWSRQASAGPVNFNHKGCSGVTPWSRWLETEAVGVGVAEI
ncbi:hypothetical protein U1Q18_011639 [Sarracenia purpurea var. burkii]